MNFNFTEQETNFRNEIKNWLSNNLPKNISEKVRKYQRLHKEDYEILSKCVDGDITDAGTINDVVFAFDIALNK
mgnify:CR=1 FL=1